MGSPPCGSCAGLRVALHGEEESRPTQTRVFILGLSVVATASFPFACDMTEGVATAPIFTQMLAGDGGWEAPAGSAVLATWVLSLGPMGMVPFKPVGLFVVSVANSAGGAEAPPPVSTSPVPMAEAAVALLPSAEFAVTSWEEEEAASSAACCMCRRKVDMASCGPTSMVMWSDPIESSVLLVVLLAGSVGNGGANGSAPVCKVGRGG